VSTVVLVLLATVSLVWPATLGGSTVYVSTHGDSMAPRFSTGDLAVLRSADGYAVGDVVAYESPSIGTTVMHRIVERSGDRFVTQGDNNDFLDPDEPTADEMLGRLWFRIPQGGKALAALTSPAVLALVAVASGALLWTVRRPRGRSVRRASWSLPARPLTDPLRVRQALVGAGSLAAVAAVGSVVLLLVPATQVESSTVTVTQSGRYGYTAAADTGTTYPTGRVETGDPVYTRLVDDLTVSFEDTLTGPGLTGLAGTLLLEVRLAAADGWSAVLERGRAVPFEGGTAAASVTVDTEAAREVLAEHQDEVGAPGGGATVTVVPVVEAAGELERQPVSVGAPAGLAFTLDEVALRPVAGEDAVAPTTESSVAVDRTVPGTLSMAGATVPVATARTVVGGLLVLAGLGLGVVLALAGPLTGAAADDAVLRRSSRLVPVAGLSMGDVVVEMSDATALSRLAERVDGIVLHHAAPHADVYVVQHAGTTYRLTVAGGAVQPQPARRWSAVGRRGLLGRFA
jgi:signal peptidase I